MVTDFFGYMITLDGHLFSIVEDASFSRLLQEIYL